MATLKDVAKLACVDVSTVSRALNNTSYVHRLSMTVFAELIQGIDEEARYH